LHSGRLEPAAVFAARAHGMVRLAWSGLLLEQLCTPPRAVGTATQYWLAWNSFALETIFLLTGIYESTTVKYA
jgi:hypothetical protein